MEPFIDIQCIWQDSHMIQLKINASNGFFSGTTCMYESRENLKKFAQDVIKFPQSKEDILQYGFSEKSDSSVFGLKFYSIDNLGHVAVQISMISVEEYNTGHEVRKESTASLTMEMEFEVNELMSFHQQLERVIENEFGKATLKGITKKK